MLQKIFGELRQNVETLIETFKKTSQGTSKYYEKSIDCAVLINYFKYFSKRCEFIKLTYD